MPAPNILPPLPKKRVNPDAQEALNRMHRASLRGTGCHLTAAMIAGLATTMLGEIWGDDELYDESI